MSCALAGRKRRVGPVFPGCYPGLICCALSARALRLGWLATEMSKLQRPDSESGRTPRASPDSDAAPKPRSVWGAAHSTASGQPPFQAGGLSWPGERDGVGNGTRQTQPALKNRAAQPAGTTRRAIRWRRAREIVFSRTDGPCWPAFAVWPGGCGAASGGGSSRWRRVPPRRSRSGGLRSYPTGAAGR